MKSKKFAKYVKKKISTGDYDDDNKYQKVSLITQKNLEELLIVFAI